MRVVKEHDERKNEIIGTAAQLFVQKGYEKCSVNDILNQIGIAKGTFYHYFKSKEEVLDAIIAQGTDLIVARVQQVVHRSDLTPEDKLLHAFLAMQIEDQMQEGLLEEIHKAENALMHQKSLCATVTALTPLLTEVVQEGIDAGVFHSAYPEQYMQIFLTSTVTLMDEGIFPVEQERAQELFQALIAMLEQMLGVPAGSIIKKVAKHWKF